MRRCLAILAPWLAVSSLLHAGEAPSEANVEVEYYKSGELQTSTPLKDGKKHGTERRYYRNGVLRAKVGWRNGKMHGPAAIYYVTGQVKYETRYEDGEEVKEARNGVTMTGLRGGPYPGSTYSYMPYKNGKKHGNELRFYASLDYDTRYDSKRERLAEILPYRDGLVHGTMVRYAQGGWVRAFQEYRNGEPHGDFRRYNHDGMLIGFQEYRNGKPYGAFKRYSRGGKATGTLPIDPARRLDPNTIPRDSVPYSPALGFGIGPEPAAGVDPPGRAADASASVPSPQQSPEDELGDQIRRVQVTGGVSWILFMPMLVGALVAGAVGSWLVVRRKATPPQ